MPAVTGRVVSSEMAYAMSAGKRFFSSSIVFFAPSATASAFDPGIWKTAMTAAGLPLKRANCVYVCVPSSMRATSFRRTTEPSGFSRTTMSPNSSGVTSRPCARIV